MIDPKSARRGLFLVFVILFLDIMGIAIIMPVLPSYLEELTGATIGQAAVEASLVAAPMIIVVAATGITGLLVTKLNAPILLWRFISLVMASCFGFLGLTISSSLMLIHMYNLTSFGVEEVLMTGNFRPQDVKDIVIRAPWRDMVQRPSSLTENRIRQEGKRDGE